VNLVERAVDASQPGLVLAALTTHGEGAWSRRDHCVDVVQGTRLFGLQHRTTHGRTGDDEHPKFARAAGSFRPARRPRRKSQPALNAVTEPCYDRVPIDATTCAQCLSGGWAGATQLLVSRQVTRQSLARTTQDAVDPCFPAVPVRHPL